MGEVGGEGEVEGEVGEGRGVINNGKVCGWRVGCESVIWLVHCGCSVEEHVNRDSISVNPRCLGMRYRLSVFKISRKRNPRRPCICLLESGDRDESVIPSSSFVHLHPVLAVLSRVLHVRSINVAGPEDKQWGYAAL